MNYNKIADIIYKAYVNKEAINPIITEYSNLSINDAYKIQKINADRQLENDKLVGMKVGVSSKIMQEMLGIDTPTFGFIYESRKVVDTVSISDFSQPRIEPEIAFVLKEDLNKEELSIDDVIQAVDYVVGAFEIADCRTKDWKMSAQDMIADNAVFGSYVLGDVKKKLSEIDLVNEIVDLEKNNQVISSGSGAACLDNPINSLYWLATTLLKYGLSLKKGDIILSGALTKADPVSSSNNYKAKFSTLGSVEVKFI